MQLGVSQLRRWTPLISFDTYVKLPLKLIAAL